MALTDRLAAFGSFPFFHLLILSFLFETLLEITVSAENSAMNEHSSYRLVSRRKFGLEHQRAKANGTFHLSAQLFR